MGHYALDSFTVPTITGRLYFVLVVLAHERRRIVHVNVTQHPNAAWSLQQIREALRWDDVAPSSFLLHDRDAIFEGTFDRSAPATTAPRVPRLRPSITDASRARQGPA